MKNPCSLNRFLNVFLFVGVAMAAVVPAVRAVPPTEKQHAPQRVALPSSSERAMDGDNRGGDQGGCCQGVSCTVETEPDCTDLGGMWLGLATDCTPNCCPVVNPTGSDCVCATSTCVEVALTCIGGADDGSACSTNADCAVTDPLDPGECGNLNLGFLCGTDADCEGGIATCVLQCEPNGVTQLRHPYECHDDFGSPLEPSISCDPALDVAFECPPIPCTSNADCPDLNPCDGGFCQGTLFLTCEQSFTTSFTVTRNDTIAGDLFTAQEGEACSLNTSSDGVGWFELINLPDPTPGDGADDCYVLTVGLCCTDPVLTPAWPFLSQYIECPCFEGQDVFAIPPDFDSNGDQLDGFGAGSQARVAGRCEDDNYSATFTVPPGEYAYQINADLNCAGSVIPCDTPDDCPGSACIAPNPDYTVVFTTESCQIAACCVAETCIETNRLDCAAQGGTYLGDGEQPIVTCQDGACDLGACCVGGTCKDDALSDELTECEAQAGVYFGGTTCFRVTCPTCPYDKPQNCQQVQTIFGAVPLMDRNPENGSSDGTMGAVLADDVKFGGSSVDQICWRTGFFATPCCGTGCAQNVDTTWQIRIYETDPDCDALPGIEVGMSTVTVLNKIEGTGQGTATWDYSGSLDTPIALPSGGFAGDTYWFEVSAFGDPGCEVRATWSRDHGNGHYVSAPIAADNEPRDYNLDGIGDVDVGFCENSGILSPGAVLGSCCTCPANCQENITARECGVIRGVWSACATCAETPCPGPPANDHCESPYLISNVPQSTDGLDVLTITNQNNICADDDGPGLSAAETTGLCAPSLGGGADLHNDIWYKYTPPVHADLRIESCGAADMDQMLAVYDADNGCPVTEDEELACDDDSCGITAGPADVTVRVTAGHQYLIRCGGWNNEVPGGFDGSPRGSFSLNWSLTNVDCPGIENVIRAGPPHDIRKNRYISIDPRGAAQTLPNAMHIRVAVNSTLVPGLIGSGPWWATDPVNGQPPSPATCISIVSATKPTIEPDFTGCNVVHLTGCPIIPTTTYLIQAEVGGELSCQSLFDTMAKATGKWLGDVIGSFTGPPDNLWTGPNGVTSIDDAIAAIKTFINPNAFNATHLSVTDVHPALNGVQMTLGVNINDVLLILFGFQGKTWGEVASPFPDDEIPDLTECP